MSYCNSYGTNGLSGTAVDDYKLKLKRCRETMSCTSGRCMSYNYNNNKCTCVPCDIDINATSGPTRGGYAGIIPVRGVNGLNESFLESLGSLGNLAIIGLAIYGGFCLAKKL